jgi:hypothetical protein
LANQEGPLAHEVIATYLLWEIPVTETAHAPPLSLPDVHRHLEQAKALPTSHVLRALLTLIFEGTPTQPTRLASRLDVDDLSANEAEEVLRTYADTAFLAQLVVADRLYTGRWALSSRPDKTPMYPDSPSSKPTPWRQPCDEALSLYYKAAQESIQDLLENGGEKGIYVSIYIYIYRYHQLFGNVFSRDNKQ